MNTHIWVAEKMGDFIRPQKDSSVKPLQTKLDRLHFLKLGKTKLNRASKLYSNYK